MVEVVLIGSFRNIRLRETLFRETPAMPRACSSLLPNVFPNMRGSGGACGLLRVPLAKLPAAPACSFPHATTSTFSSDWPSTLDKRPALRRRNACGRINPTWDSGLALDDAPALPVLSDAVCLMGLPFASSKSIARLTSCSARGQVSMTPGTSRFSHPQWRARKAEYRSRCTGAVVPSPK